MAKVNLNLEIDVQEAFLALSQSEKRRVFSKKHRLYRWNFRCCGQMF